jgi:lysophospholipase
MQIVSDPIVDALEGLHIFRVEGPEQKSIRAAFVPCLKGPVRGSVIVSPGRTEYIEKHAETARDLVARGFHVLIIDQRGQGWSDRLAADPMAGHLDSYAHAVSHLRLAIEAVSDRLTGPRLLLCHSMGGAIALEALLTDNVPGVVGAAFSAPMWGLNAPAYARVLVNTLCALGRGEAFAPTTPQKWLTEPFEGNQVTHSTVRFARNQALFLAEPAIQIGGSTNGWLKASFDLFDSFTPDRLGKLDVPVLVVSGEAETIVANTSHVRIAGQVPNGTYRTIPGAKHELLNERDDLRDQFWAHFDSWLDHVLTARMAQAS